MSTHTTTRTTLRAQGCSGPSCVAKNRYGLPEQLPLAWDAFMSAFTQPQGTPTNG